MSRVPGRGSRADNRGQPTIERRKFIIGAGALATGSAAAMGTGALSNTEMERTASIDVADDAAGIIGLDTESQFARLEEDQYGNDRLEIYLDGTLSDAEGVNPNSQTVISDLFRTQNNQENNLALEFSFIGGDPRDIELFFEDSDGSDELVDGGSGITHPSNIPVVTRDYGANVGEAYYGGPGTSRPAVLEGGNEYSWGLKIETPDYADTAVSQIEGIDRIEVSAYSVE